MRRIYSYPLAAAMVLGAPSWAFAACTISNQQVEQELSQIEGIGSGEYGAVRRDVRELRNAALVLQRYGKDEQCQQVASAMNEILRDPKASSELRARSMSGQPAADTDVNAATGTADQKTDQTAKQNPDETGSTGQAAQTMEQRAAAAVPFNERKMVMSSAELIGADVYGASNQSLGEIDDIVVSPDNRPAYALVSYGGFLGMGEDQVVVPVSNIRVSPDNYIFVNLTAEQLAAAPKLQRGTSDWWTNEAWRAENDTYYKSIN